MEQNKHEQTCHDFINFLFLCIFYKPNWIKMNLHSVHLMHIEGKTKVVLVASDDILVAYN